MSQSVVGAINRFGFEVLSLSIRSDKRCGICPLNVYQCLLMAAAGSEGRVLAGFEKALHFQTGSLVDRIRDSASLEEYSQSSPTVELNSVSSAWHDSLFEINQGWKEIVKGVFKAPVQPIELAPMNAFIKKGTNGKLKDLISEDSIKGCALMLITCLYFKAKWVESFDPRDTVAGIPFFAFTGKPQKCFMMQRTGPMQYVDDPRMEICTLPYRAEKWNSSLPRWKAAVFLPKLKGLEAIQDILSTFANEPSRLGNALSHANRAGRPNPEVNLRLPRFTLKAHLDLREALEQLGLGPAFSPSRDFAPITDTSELKIDQVTHDLVMEVNEEGTEMAAVTAVCARGGCDNIVMNCNRPFIFMVFDDTRKLVLCSTVVSSM